MAGRLATILLFVCSSALVFALDTAKQSFNIILQIGAGTGLLYLMRWFWWRVTAWCEIVAMSSSFGISVIFLILTKNGIEIDTYRQLLFTVAFTTVCWILTAYVGPQTDPATLIDFYRKVHPFGPGWRRVRALAGIPKAEADAWAQNENIPLSLLGWSTGCLAIWSALFMVGNFLYGRTGYAVALLAIFVVSGIILIRVINRLWA
jgi:SSS family solute:Na+ symporter